MSTTHTIQVSDTLVKTYPAVDAEYAEFRKAGGQPGNLHGAAKAWQEQVLQSGGLLVSVQGFVWLDDTDFVYLVEVDKTGSHKILGAARG